MQEMVLFARREIDRAVRASLRFLSKIESFPSFRSWLKRSSKGFNLRSEHLEVIESPVYEKIFRFRSGRACQ